MKKNLAMGIVVLALLALSFLNVQARSAEKTRYMAEVAAGGEIMVGIARIENGDGADAGVATYVTITLDSLTKESQSQSQNVYSASINEGGCGTVGVVKYSLANVVNGASRTVLKVPYDTVVGSRYHIVLSAPTDGPMSYTDCGDSIDGRKTDAGQPEAYALFGMPGTDLPIIYSPVSSTPQIPGMPKTGDNNQPDVPLALVVLALGMLGLGVGVKLARSKSS